MNRLKNLFAGILCLTMGVFSLVSCNDDDDPALTGSADVYIVDQKIDDAVKYAITVQAVSNYEIKSATVTTPGTNGKTYELTASSAKIVFNYIPAETDYSTELPSKGDYKIEITSKNGEKITVKDVLGDEKLAHIAIKTAEMNNSKLKTTWDKVESVDTYQIRLYSENKKELIYYSNYLVSSKVEYEFGSTSNKWVAGKSPVKNTNYVVELIGLRFETGVTVNQLSNIQFTTLDSKTIKWE
jgi:predicted RNA-binding protein